MKKIASALTESACIFRYLLLLDPYTTSVCRNNIVDVKV